MAKWLLLLYRLPRTPTGPRMAIWRSLRKIEGGEYLQDGVFVVKATPLSEVTLEDIAHDVRNFGGEASLATASVDDERHFAQRLKAAAEASRVTVKEPPARSRKRARAR